MFEHETSTSTSPLPQDVDDLIFRSEGDHLPISDR